MSSSARVRILVVDVSLKTEKALAKVLERDLAGCSAFALRNCAVLSDTCSVSQLYDSFDEQIRIHQCHIVIINKTLLIDEDLAGWIRKAQPARCVLHMGGRSDTIEIMRALDAGLLISSPLKRSRVPHRPLDLVAKRAIWRHRARDLEIRQEHLLRQIAQRVSKANQLEVRDDEIRELLEYLFPDALVISLSPLWSEGSNEIVPSGRSVLIQVTEITKEGDVPGPIEGHRTKPQPRVPVVVKIAPPATIGKEAANYQRYIKGRLQGMRHTYLERHDLRWNIGGIVYSFLGTRSKPAGPIFPLRPFADVYAEKKHIETDLRTDAQPVPDPIIGVIEEVFSSIWGTLYSTLEDSEKSILAQYNMVWGEEWIDRLKRLTHDIVWPWMAENLPALPNPAKWLLKNQNQNSASRLAITHGDLRLSNVLVDETLHSWLIDFERSGWGPRLQDFTEFQFDILTRPGLIDTPYNDIMPLYDLYVALAGLTESGDPFSYAVPRVGPIEKAFHVTHNLLKLARELTQYKDHREYLWGLLLNGLYINTRELPVYRADVEQTRRKRAWLLASIICGRLETWGHSWPPPHWPKGQTPKGEAMSEDAAYDVFISYSSKDRVWVHDELLLRLEKANLRVCVDQRDFEVGAPSVTEMERAVKTSRKTVLVLTPDYIQSAWAEFEQLMLMTLDAANRERRLIPLLKEKCELPLRISYLNYVNLADPDDVELSWKRLLDALKRTPR